MSNIPIKILFITDGLHGGGKERQLVEIIKALKTNCLFSLGVVTFNRNQHYSATVRELVPFFVELRKRPTRLEPCFTIWRYVLWFKPDIIHTWDTLASFYAWLPARILGVKLIDGSIRDAGIEKGWQYIYKKFFLHRSDLVISNSVAGLKAYKIEGEVLYNAIHTERFVKKTESSEFNIVMAANFTDYKDHKTFFQAAVKLLSNKTIDHVYLLGEGTHRPKYQEWIANNYPAFLTKFIFTGAVKNVELYLSKCTVGVLCSTAMYKEGISNSVLEYMAAGLIAIATDVGGTNEIISNGVNGFLVKPGNSDEIAEIITQIKNQEVDTLRIVDNAIVTIRSKFDHISNINKLINIYKGLCHC